jgi:hypothetical protein
MVDISAEVNFTEMKNLTYFCLATRHLIEIQNNYLLNLFETNQIIELVFTCIRIDHFKKSSTEVKGLLLSYPHSIKYWPHSWSGFNPDQYFCLSQGRWRHQSVYEISNIFELFILSSHWTFYVLFVHYDLWKIHGCLISSATSHKGDEEEITEISMLLWIIDMHNHNDGNIPY